MSAQLESHWPSLLFRSRARQIDDRGRAIYPKAVRCRKIGDELVDRPRLRRLPRRTYRDDKKKDEAHGIENCKPEVFPAR